MMSVPGDIKREVAGLDTGARSLRNFGVLLSVVCGIAAVVVSLKGRSSWQGWAAGCLACLAAGTLSPAVLRAPYRLWMLLGLSLGWLVTRCILLLAYALIMTPMAWVLRSMGKDILEERIDRQAPSYWKKHETPGDVGQYEKQF